MKVIFLDHDGVICLAQQWGSREKKWKLNPVNRGERQPIESRFDNFDKGAIKVLNEIIDKTGAEIVVSSDWQAFATIDELGDYYTLHGINKRPIDTTHIEEGLDLSLFPSDYEWTRQFAIEQTRCLFIKRWIDSHPSITHWCAVDDLDLGEYFKPRGWTPGHSREWGLKNFIHTPREREGIKQSGIKDKIIKMLNDEK